MRRRFCDATNARLACILIPCHSEPSAAEGEDVPRNLLFPFPIGILPQSRGKQSRTKFAPIPISGRYSPSEVSQTVNLCGKTVVRLSEKKAYDETPLKGGRVNG